MSTQLPSEFTTFCSLTKQLRAILKETQKCFKDINAVGKYEGNQIVSAELTTEEEAEIEQLVRKVPCLIVFGQNAYAKAVVINELFSQPLLPTTTSIQEGSHARWRMVRFLHGRATSVSLTLPGAFVLVDNLNANKRAWKTLPEDDLKVDDDDLQPAESAKNHAVMEVKLNHSLLKEGGEVVMSACNHGNLELTYNRCTEDTIPVLIYAITDNSLATHEIEDLKALKELAPDISILFVRVPTFQDEKLTVTPVLGQQNTASSSSGDASKHSYCTNTSQPSSPNATLVRSGASVRRERLISISTAQSSLTLFQQLAEAGYLSLLPSTMTTDETSTPNMRKAESELCENFDTFGRSAFAFARQCLQVYLVRTTSLLHLVHTRCLQMFIMTAFDMARDMQVTPLRLEFAREREKELYSSLMDIANRKQYEIRCIIQSTIVELKPRLMEKAASYEFIGVEVAENGWITTAKDLKICIGQIQNLVIGDLNTAIAGELLKSVDILRDSYTGVLSRCLEKIEESDCTDQTSYKTSEAFRNILNSAYQVEITVKAGSSLMHLLLEKMRQLMQGMPWRTHPQINPEWKSKVAEDMLNSLSEVRLAQSICTQIKERVRSSHSTFSSALKQLQSHHSGRLERTEEQQVKLRKNYAPKVARLALESTSFRDYILHGMPKLGREIGRGQYGVVYSCDGWGPYKKCAIKSVVPPDEKHWNDLALEFYYTKNIPEHPRIVSLRGSVIDYMYGDDSTYQPAVLLIMDKMQRDLYAAIKSNVDWPTRLQVAMDVIVGLRFLHSQALVHRDIKLKNVLLDRENRGCITDLGFCKPEAMMSGSIVGTPIHMAPELFSGAYDHTVDIYAFGILFWYISAGHVRLPKNYEQCANKDILWSSVCRGVRPERLNIFDATCWSLMERCWHADPQNRPLLGDVESQLADMLDACQHCPVASPALTLNNTPHHVIHNDVAAPLLFGRRPDVS